MAEKSESLKALFDKTLQKLVEYKQVLPDIADLAKQEFDYFLALIVKVKKADILWHWFQRFTIRCFFLKGNNGYRNLTKVLKIIMTLSQG